MKFLIPILFLASVSAQACEIGRPVTKIEEYLSKSLDNHDLNLNYVLSTLMKEYATYIEIESLYYNEDATPAVQECLCPYIKYAQETLDYYYLKTEGCLPHDICKKPECDVKGCSDLYYDAAVEKLYSISFDAQNCYNEHTHKCEHTSPHCHEEL